MEIRLEDTALIICLEGHIDTSNAPAVEAEIVAHPGYAAASAICVDAEKLEYISSAGLRILLKLRKRNPNFKIVNVSPAVYEVFDMTGFVEMMQIEKAYRRLSVEGCTELGRGSNGTVYRFDPETVVKVYHNPNALEDIHRERELARNAFVLGIPTAIPYDVVKVDNTYGSVFELLSAKSFSKLIKQEPEKIDFYIGEFTNLLKQIHSTKVSEKDFPSMKDVAVSWAEFLQGHIPADQSKKLVELFQAVPETHTLIHGDYHTNNVEMQDGEILLIDMDTLSYGHPIFELGSMFLGFQGFGEADPSIIQKFLKLPFETAGYIWSQTLKLYLNTEDENVLRAVEDKAKLIGYTRLLRRTIRRYPKDDPMGQKIIAQCKDHIADLLSRVDTLEF